MKALAVICALLVFEMALVAASQTIVYNKTIPIYKNNSYVVAVQLDEGAAMDSRIISIPEFSIPPYYSSENLANKCSSSFDKSNELFKIKRYEEAITYLNETIINCPGYSDAWYDRGYNRFQLERYSEALNDFNVAIKLDPTDADYWAFYGIVLYKLKRYNDALNAFNTSKSINPNLPYASEWINPNP